MQTPDDLEINQYTLSIILVKMKVKFPCKMKLEHSGNTVTDQVQSMQHSKFIFNQQVTIQQPADQQSFDFNIILVTQKGSKYVSGVLKLNSKDIEKAQGQKLICPLTKCLDNQAYCQLKISKVKISKTHKRISVSSTLIELKKLNSDKDNTKTSPKEDKDLLSPKSHNNKKSNGVETRSQIGFGGLGIRNTHEWDDTRSKGAAHTLIYKSSFLKSPKAKKTVAMGSPKSKLGMDYQNFNNQQYELLSQRQKLSSCADSEVYKEGYQKLKQKYKSQSETLKCEQSKRQQLQANENNFKVEVMRLKLKTQQQQRIITQKNEKINQLQIVISQINKQDLDMAYLKEENKNLQEKVQMLNDVINGLRKENQGFKRLAQDRQQNDKRLINELKGELETCKEKLQAYTSDSTQMLKQKTQQILNLTTEVKSKSTQIELQRSEIHKLEAHIQAKIYEFEKTLQVQKNASAQLGNELRQKIETLERDKKSLQKQISQAKVEKDKIKTLILKAEYDKKILNQEQKVLKGQMVEYKALKQSHSQVVCELAILIEDNSHLRKQMQLQSQSKQVNLQEINEQFDLKLNYYKRQTKEFEEKYKALSTAKIDLQTQLQTANNSIEKQKRLTQSLNNDVISLKSGLKDMRNYATQLQQQKLNFLNELSITNNKLKFGELTSKAEVEKYKNELERTRNQLASQNHKAISLFDAKSNLEIELNKNRIQLQYHEEKIDKLFSANKEYQSTIEHMVKEHEAQSGDYQQQILKQQTELKSCHESLHKFELEKLSLLEKIQIMKKQQKVSEEKISHFENQLRIKGQEIAKCQERQKKQEKAYMGLENDHNSIKHEHTILRNNFSKVEKISQLKTQDIESLKKDIQKLEEEKTVAEKVETQLRDQLKKEKENGVKVEMRIKALDKDFNKFKELMFKTIKGEFAKLPLLANNPNYNPNPTDPCQQKLSPQKQLQSDTSQPNNLLTIHLTGSAKQIEITPDQVLLQTLTTASILTSLTSSITDSKTTLYKLIEHNKQLKKQIEFMKEQSEQSANKYQFTEIELHRELQEMGEEMNLVYEEKEEEIVNFERLVSELNGRLHEKENLCEELSQQIQELQYAISSLKLDFQTNNTKNDKKVALLKASLSQLEEKIEYYKVTLNNQQDQNHELEEKVEILKGQKDELTLLNVKQKFAIEELTDNKEKLEQVVQELNKERKSLLEKVSETQIRLNEEKGLKDKFSYLLQQEEKKLMEAKEFATQLMKQKQEIIKSELEKTDRILELQTTQIQLRRDLQISSQQTQRIKSQLQDIKEKHRKQLARSKTLDTLLAQALNKCKKLTQKLQEKQKQIQMKDEIIARLDKKYKELTQKNYKETLDLHSQIDSKYNENINISKEMNQKVLVLEAKIEELEHIKAKQHHELLMGNDELLAEREQSALLKRENLKLEAELEEINDEYKSLEKRNEKLATEIENREEQLSELNDRIIQLEGEVEAVSKDKANMLEDLNIDWTRRYESVIEEHEHRLMLVEKEREMIRSQLQEKINELQLSNNQNKNSELGINDIKKNYEEKIKKVENDRLSTILTKNNEIKKLTEETKILLEQVKKLQTSQKQNSELLENIRKRLLNEEKLRKESQEKLKTSKKLQEAEINSLLSKETRHKQEKEQLYQAIWANEREVRKVVQNYVKKVLDQCDNVHIDKITSSSKGLESDVVKAMTQRLSPSLGN